jgi:beta-lactamase superfamily II metal-dependent hydrolase
MEVKFLSAGCGDGIHIRFIDDDFNFRNILIDGGTERGQVYDLGLKTVLIDIIDRHENIDLWIITHIDDDHVGCILRFFADRTLSQRFDLTKTIFWYNYSIWDFEVSTNERKKSVSQGIRLREYLKKNSLPKEFITNRDSELTFFNATIRVLSPDEGKLSAFLEKWRNEEVKLFKSLKATTKSSRKHDYLIPWTDFNQDVFTEDSGEENGSSIAFLFQHQGTTLMFCADAHPTLLAKSLRAMGYGPANPLKLQLMQVPHHGSKKNTNNELLSLVECENFIISADGFNRSNLPNKECLVRIIKRSKNVKTNFYLTHKNDRTISIFKVDAVSPPPCAIHFPVHGEHFIKLTI